MKETHQSWDFDRSRAVVLIDDRRFPNLYPLARELRKWMLRDPTAAIPLPVRVSSDLTNPYSLSLRWLTSIFCALVNDLAALISDAANRQCDPLEMDIRRVRLISELELYTARLLEALAKQLLHCTTFPPSAYANAPIERLFAHGCIACKEAEMGRHTIDLLGSVAHRYGLCGPYGHLKTDIKALNLVRNSRAAHANVDPGDLSSTADAAIRLTDETISARGEQLIHALQHLAEIEDKVGIEIASRFVGEFSPLPQPDRG